jgi:arabinose-5-phosphate isomerase
MRVEQLMHVDAPIVQLQASMPDVMQAMSRTAPGRLRSFGMTCVVGGDGRLAGVITDGDLRRLLMSAQQSGSGSVLDRTAADVMSRSPVTVSRAMLAVEALRLMEEKKITSVVVVGHAQQVEGVLHVHDLWRTQLF